MPKYDSDTFYFSKHTFRTFIKLCCSLEREQKDGLGQLTTQRSVGDIQRQMQQLDRQAEYAHRGLDYDSEVIRGRKRLEREQAERERSERSQREKELASGNAQSEQSGSDGNKSGNKKNNNYFGK